MTDSLTFGDWMSDADSILWHMERDPLLRSTIVSIWLLESCPSERRLRTATERAAASVPRFRQRVVADPAGLAPPRWEDDPLFEIDYHVRRLRAPGKGLLRDVLDLAEPIASQAFDKDRPLWETYLVDGLRDGKAAVISKAHHAMTDGIGGLSILQALVDRTPDGRKGKKLPRSAPRPPAGPRSGPIEQLSNAFFHRAADETGRGLRTAAALGKGWGSLMLDPLGTSQRFQETASSIVRTLRPISEPLSPLMDRRSMTMRLEVMEFELEALKKAARKLEVTLNDIFVTAITGGLRLYHEQMGATVDELRMSMPINVRDGDKGQRAGNQFAAARVQVPVSIEDPLERLNETHDRLHREKNEPAVSWIEEITTTINRLGPAAATRVVGSMFKAVDFVSSNVPGMPFEVYFAGSRIEALYPFGPPTGAALNVTLFSYDGKAFIGINCDRAAVSDPNLLLECLGEGFAELLGS